jgi:hypothetical protein
VVKRGDDPMAASRYAMMIAWFAGTEGGIERGKKIAQDSRWVV